LTGFARDLERLRRENKKHKGSKIFFWDGEFEVQPNRDREKLRFGIEITTKTGKKGKTQRRRQQHTAEM
jgi:hypothetical protein